MVQLWNAMTDRSGNVLQIFGRAMDFIIFIQAPHLGRDNIMNNLTHLLIAINKFILE